MKRLGDIVKALKGKQSVAAPEVRDVPSGQETLSEENKETADRNAEEPNEGKAVFDLVLQLENLLKQKQVLIDYDPPASWTQVQDTAIYYKGFYNENTAEENSGRLKSINKSLHNFEEYLHNRFPDKENDPEIKQAVKKLEQIIQERLGKKPPKM